MKKSKQILSTLLVLLSALNLTACARNQSRIVMMEGTQEKTTIHLLTNTRNMWNLKAFETAISSFKADRPDVEVDFEGYSNSESSKSIAQIIDERMAAGLVEDLATMDVANIFRYANTGDLLDLTDTEAAENMTEMARADSSVNGRVMSVPLAMVSYGMYVNMDLLKECNLDLPTNWEEFIHCCQILQENGHQPIVGTNTYPKLFVLAAMGDIYISEDTEEIIKRLNSGEEKISKYAGEGFEHLAYLIEKGYINGPAAYEVEPGNLNELFKTGEEGAFVLATSNHLSPKELPFDIAFIGIPGTQGMVSLLASDRRIVVMADSKSPDICTEFLSYLGHQDVWDSLPEMFGLIPAYTTITSNNKKDKRLEQVYENIESGRKMLIQDYNLLFEQWGNMDDICDPMLLGATAREQSAAFDRLQQEAIDAAK